MLVVDASAILELVLRTKSGDHVSNIIFDTKTTLAAPELLFVETIQVLRRITHSKELSSQRADQAFQDFSDLPITYYSHLILIDRIWELRRNFTSYDSTYIALAEILKCKLITCDTAFKKGYGKFHHVDVILIKN